MVTTLEDRGGGLNTGNSSSDGRGRDFLKCPGPGCKTKIRGQHLCTPCMNKLPRGLRERMEATIGQDPDDSTDMLITTCLEELANQRVEQVKLGGGKRRRH